MIRAFAFDLDGTLTQYKTLINDTNRSVLEKLSQKYTLIVSSSGDCMRVRNQIKDLPVDIIGNYGMQYARYENGEFKIVHSHTQKCENKEAVEKSFLDFREKHGFTSFQGNNIEYHDSGCITLPLLGTDANKEEKLKFDPDRKKRRSIYAEVCELFSEYNVFVAGSSSFDMAPKPFNKYYALDMWCKENGFLHDEVVFVGDDYGFGGNDESVYLSDFRFITIDDYRRLPDVMSVWLDESIPDIDSLLGNKTECECKKMHSCDIEKVLIRNGALNELPAITAKYNHITLVCDENTYSVCANKVIELLEDKIKRTLTYRAKGFVVPDEKAVEELNNCICGKTDLIIGVGSGVINDLCKHVSYQHNLPYFIVATAPSMDGYASKGAAMIFGGMKVTTNAHVPKAIIADTAILANAPLEMIKAGYGDIIGKYSCLNDWRLSALINGEYLCEYVYGMTYKTVEHISKIGPDILSRDEKSISFLMRALIVVGIAMAYMGNSRPASGSEHHLSHYFEIVGLLRGEPYFCHGIDVAYSAYITSLLRKELISLPCPKAKKFNFGDWEKNIYRVYSNKNDSSVAEGIIKLQNQLGLIYEDRFDIYEKKWSQIQEILKNSPSPNEMLQMLSDIELPLKEFEKMYSQEKLCDAIKYAKDLKDRYSVLWLYNDMCVENA